MKKTFTLLLIAGFVCLLTSCEKQEEMTVTPIFKEKNQRLCAKGTVYQRHLYHHCRIEQPHGTNRKNVRYANNQQRRLFRTEQC